MRRWPVLPHVDRDEITAMHAPQTCLEENQVSIKQVKTHIHTYSHVRTHVCTYTVSTFFREFADVCRGFIMSGSLEKSKQLCSQHS